MQLVVLIKQSVASNVRSTNRIQPEKTTTEKSSTNLIIAKASSSLIVMEKFQPATIGQSFSLNTIPRSQNKCFYRLYSTGSLLLTSSSLLQLRITIRIRIHCHSGCFFLFFFFAKVCNDKIFFFNFLVSQTKRQLDRHQQIRA